MLVEKNEMMLEMEQQEEEILQRRNGIMRNDIQFSQSKIDVNPEYNVGHIHMNR